jgi:hypothetical protein
VLTKIPIARTADGFVFDTQRIFQYRISGLPPGENAFIAQFPDHGWRILRWNDQWHGNWTGNYPTADAALKALRDELFTAASAAG